MLTVCPKCTLTLAVSAADLRLGQGYVRCGRCSDVFNALLTLRDESVMDPGSTVPHLLVNPEELAADEAEVFIDTAAEAGEAAAKAELVAELPPAETIPETAAAPEAEAIVAVEPPPTEIMGVHWRPLPPPVHDRRFSLQVAGIVLATLLLGAQCINQWRDSIASNPRWYPLMDRIYSALGQPLLPDWNLGDYDLRQLGTASYGGAEPTLWIKLQLGNRAARALPWPQLRLSLSDRYGKHLASRMLQPRDYLTGAHPGGSFMPPAQQLETEIGVISSLATSSSFELDVCLPTAGGLRCANDEILGPPART
jgi:predicted Zn finger-like uncharacterized protein